MSTKELGQKGEDLACEYLVKNGYKILGKNYRIKFGEIDIIARKKGLFADETIHFVEVKTSQGFYPERSEGLSAEGFFPEQRVDWKKQNKYKRLAEIWLQKNKFPQNYPCQVDVVAVSMSGEKPEINFFENIVKGK